MLYAREKAWATDIISVIKALRANRFGTPLGKMSFDEKGDAKGIGFAV